MKFLWELEWEYKKRCVDFEENLCALKVELSKFKFFFVFNKYLTNGLYQQKTEGRLAVENFTLYNFGSYEFSSKARSFREKWL